jgi:hypothetical protein
MVGAALCHTSVRPSNHARVCTQPPGFAREVVPQPRDVRADVDIESLG